MSSRSSQVFLITLSMLFLLSCGNKMYLRGDIDIPVSKDLTLSVIPVFDDVPVDVRSIFEYEFDDPAAPYVLKKLPDELYKQEPDSETIKVMMNIQKIEYNSGDMNNGPDLKDNISAADLAEFKRKIGEPDLLLVPAKYSLMEMNFSVMGKTTIRLYDLHSDKLIFEKKENLNVGPGGEVRSGGLLQAMGIGTPVSSGMIDVAKDCSSMLASVAFNDINKYVFKKGE